MVISCMPQSGDTLEEKIRDFVMLCSFCSGNSEVLRFSYGAVMVSC
jgi:hypothetical protein